VHSHYYTVFPCVNILSLSILLFDGHFSSFHCMIIMNSIVMSILVHVVGKHVFSVGHVPRNGLLGGRVCVYSHLVVIAT